MDDDLEAIVSIPEELDEFYSSSNVGEELALVQDDESCENILPFNFDVALSVIEGDDETMEEEIAEALCEISGEKSFPCNSCEKVCKSKGGLTRHVNAKHGNKSTKGHDNIPSLTKEDLHFIVNKVKTKITEDGFWDSEMTSKMASVTSNDALYDHILPIYQQFCRKKNQDKFIMDFYELIPNSSGLLKCENQQLCSLIMISIPDHLVSFFKKGVTSEQEPSTSSGSETGVSTGVPTELDDHELGPLSYIAGYVLSKLKKKSAYKKNDELQIILQNMICPGLENEYIEARSRGGLVTPCKDLVRILEVVEHIFRQFIEKQSNVVKSIPSEILCNDALDSPLLKSLWENIIQDCGQETSKQTQKLCLENILKLYLKVRSFSYAKDYISKFKIQQKAAKSKSLRKELKRKSEDNK
jgi:uncharacterized C2H2 Zn-finger protein